MGSEESSKWNIVGMLSRFWGTSPTDSSYKSQSVENDKDLFKEVVSTEANLRLVPKDNSLEFYSTLNESLMFTLQAKLSGSVSKFVKSGGGNGVIITIPVLLGDGSKNKVKVTYKGNNEVTGTIKLVGTAKSYTADEQCSLEFIYNCDLEELIYTIEFPSSISVSNFKNVVDKRPIFTSVPPVAQMSAFLRAVTRRRRTVLNVLDNLKDIASPATKDTIELLRDKLAEDKLELSTEKARELKKMLEKKQIIISEHTIIAFSLFVDMEVGLLTAKKIADICQLDATPQAFFVISKYFGGDLSSADFSSLFDKSEDEWNAYIESSDIDTCTAVTNKFAKDSGQRTSAQILRQISQESNSSRGLAIADELCRQIGDADIAISDQQLALLATLSVAGRHYKPNTVIALCLFVDAEVGYIDDNCLSSMNIALNGIDTSTYAMLAVAGAFDINLRGFSLDGLSNSELMASLPNIVALTEVGFLGGFRKKSDDKQIWHWVRTAQAATNALSRKDAEFTRTILGALSVIEQLSEIDLVHIAESGRDILAAFQSDFDKTLVWRRLKNIPEESFRFPLQGEVRTSYSFIEGFSAYHFSRMIVGRLLTVKAEQLLGKDNIILVFHDNRDNRHYKFVKHISDLSSIAPPSNTGWIWKGEIVEDTDISSMPSIMRELNQNALLGRSATFSREFNTLNWMYESMRNIVERSLEYRSLSDWPEIMSRIRETMARPALRQYIRNFVDDYTCNFILDLFESDSALDIKVPINLLEKANDSESFELICLALIYTIATSNLINELLEGYYKQVDELAFRGALRERLIDIISSENNVARIIGIRMLVAIEISCDANAHMMAEYELASILDDSNIDVAMEACSGLIRLCLSNSIPLPSYAKLSKIEIPDESEDHLALPEVIGDVILDNRLLRDVRQDIEDWISDINAKNPRRLRTLPFVGSDGIVYMDKLQPFIALITALRQSDIDGNGHWPRRYFVMISERKLESISTALIESWKLMAKDMNTNLRKLISSANPAELFLDYRFFVQANVQRLRDICGDVPFLGGNESPITIYHLPPDEPLSPYRKVSYTISQNGRSESPMFMDLLHQYFESPDGKVNIVRIKSAEGVALSDLETFLPTFNISRILDIRSSERFDMERLTYVPILRNMYFTAEQVGNDPEDIADFQALMAFLKGQRYSPRKEKSEGEHDDETIEDNNISALQELPAELLEVWDAEDSEEDVNISANTAELFEEYNNLAKNIGSIFKLPVELNRQIVNMLLLVSRHSKYALVPNHSKN